MVDGQASQRDDASAVVFRVWTGVNYAFEGARLVVMDPQLRWAQVRLWLPCLVITAVLWVMLKGIMWPLSYVINWAGAEWFVEYSHNKIDSAMLSLPFVALFVLRSIYWAPLDDVFKKSLQYENLLLATSLYQLKVTGFKKILRMQLSRMGVGLGKWLLVKTLSFLPFIGWLAFPLAQLYMLSRSLGIVSAAVLTGLSFLPFVHSHARAFVTFIFICRALPRELLEPLFLRTWPTEAEKRQFFERHAPMLFGFALPFVVAIEIPVLGPVAFSIAQAAIARVVARIDPEIVDPAIRQQARRAAAATAQMTANAQ